MKKLVNPKFEYLSRSLERLMEADYFESNGDLLYNVGRNVVKRFRLDGVDVVV